MTRPESRVPYTSVPLLVDAIARTTVLRKNDYDYFVSPLESVGDPIPPGLLQEIADAGVRLGAVDGINLIVCIESMGIPFGVALSMLTSIPMVIARKKYHDLDSCIQFEARNNYQKMTYYLYGHFEARNVLLVDDIASSGRTIEGATLALRSRGCDVLRSLVAVGRGEQYVKTLSRIDLSCLALARVRVDNGCIKLLDTA